MAFWKRWVTLVLVVVLLAGCESLGRLPRMAGLARVVAPSVQHLPAEQPLRLAAVLPGSITDGDYNMLAYSALLEIEHQLGVKIKYTPDVGDLAEAQAVLEAYARDGVDLIWLHGGQFVELTLAAAPHFPNSTFIVEADEALHELPENVWVIQRDFNSGFYVLGAVAAHLTHTGVIGYAAGADMPFTHAELDAIRQSAADAGLPVTVQPVWTGDFNDPVAARRAADELIAGGADVILTSLNLGMFGVLDAVTTSDQPVWVMGKYSDKQDYAPAHYAATLLIDFRQPLAEIIAQAQDGQRGGVQPLGFGCGMRVVLPEGHLSPEIAALADEVAAAIQHGEITVERASND